ncbi:MAG: hypothetical protein POELPBGB_04029 [Bacteroidia bacterium]|nr:hypothetical protein [Bacteroidia bacterium]
MTANTESKSEVPVIRVAKTGICPSISGLSELEYHLGYEADDPQRIHIRLVRNSGNGKIHPGWLSLADLEHALASVPADGAFKASLLKPLFKGRSTNNLHFSIAVLLDCGLLKQAEEGYVRNVPEALWKELTALIAAGTDLAIPAMEPSDGDKAGATIPAEKKSKLARQRQKPSVPE